MSRNPIIQPSINTEKAAKYAKGEELSRFSGNGKTFFFNKFLSKNDTPYLAINALYGKGNRERMVLFESHYLEFIRCLREAVEKLTGMSIPGSEGRQAGMDPCPSKCPSCNFNLHEYYKENPDELGRL